MTAEDLDELAPGTPIYLPDEIGVTKMILDRRVLERDYYTFLHPDGDDGSPGIKKPVYIHVLDLLHAQTEEVEAWTFVRDRLTERIEHINKRIEVLTTN